MIHKNSKNIEMNQINRFDIDFHSVFITSPEDLQIPRKDSMPFLFENLFLTINVIATHICTSQHPVVVPFKWKMANDLWSYLSLFMAENMSSSLFQLSRIYIIRYYDASSSTHIYRPQSKDFLYSFTVINKWE